MFITGDSWLNSDLDLLSRIRIDNPGLSQRAFADLVLVNFPGRTFNGVYHKVRLIDAAVAAEGMEPVATEVG